MDTQTLLLMTSAAVGAGGAGWVGWWVRGRVHSHRLAVLDEQWTRKLKSYENEAELAKTQGTLEATRGRELAQQTEELQTRIRQLEQRLHSNGDHEGDLELRTRELEQLRSASVSELEGLRSRRDAALAERDQEIERLTAWVSELTPLSDALKDSGLQLSDRDR
ncbi:MAG TPA: hypothetical protein QF764_14155, partial [Planctomycetota bacterium]|nr:hypothetical protein [Planctomycetota bacterium]